MIAISTPDAKQSESYIATTALFFIFGSSSREDKVFLRLPAVWRDIWTEFADLRKEKSDELDRNSIRMFRGMVREKRDQELEDGVLIQGAFRNRGSTRALDTSDESGPDKSTRPNLAPEAYQKIWTEKSHTQSYKAMLVSQYLLASPKFSNGDIAITHAATYVGLQRGGPSSYRSGTGRHYLWRDWMVSR